MEAILKLFKALPIEVEEKKFDEKLLKKTIPLGFVFSPEVIYNYSANKNYPSFDELISIIVKIYGLSAKELNTSFHKSWKKIKDTPMEQLVVEQIAHYLTTYGKEHPAGYLFEKEKQWGVENLAGKVTELPDIEVDKIKDKDYIYIPKEELNIPDLEVDKIQLIIIQGYTKEQLKIRLLKLLESGVALSDETISDIIEVALFTGIFKDDIEGIRNKEARIMLYDYLDMLPDNPTEFLRFIIYKATEKTLLIKNPALIAEIKLRKNLDIIKLFEKYEAENGLEKLAEIFYRFKPLFLAFRTNEQLKKKINKIRKLAVKYHKPMPEDYLNSITAKIKKNELIDAVDFMHILVRANIFRKIRLAYALKFRTEKANSILYRVRNGKGYATDFEFKDKKGAKLILDIVLNSIVEDISQNVNNKKIYIPDFITYTLPATEKQFTGNFPSGTFITLPKNMIFGIHWKNVDNHRIDLDLSVISPEGKIGWDGSYKSGSDDILFSGDMTDADNGATELFYIKRQAANALILFVNYYNFDEDIKVPFKIIVAKEEVKGLGHNYMINPNNIAAVANSKINQKQKILGLVVTSIKDCKFYFAECSIGKSITSYGSDFVNHSKEYLFSFYKNSISLNDILIKAGAKLVTKKECEIDLSPENLSKDTILKLITERR